MFDFIAGKGKAKGKTKASDSDAPLEAYVNVNGDSNEAVFVVVLPVGTARLQNG